MTRWVDGSRPHSWWWVIAGRVAVCERLGGIGDDHRRVRRRAELRWVTATGIRSVVAVCDDGAFADYDAAGLAWTHRPYRDDRAVLADIYRQIDDSDAPVLLHGDTVNDTVAGLVAGYLLWAGAVADAAAATHITERLLRRKVGRGGAAVVLRAASLAHGAD